MDNRMVKALLEWYEKEKRTLPWRDQNNAYYTWISEIMLQQTRVEAVKPYFIRFTEVLPGIADLADCPEEKLMKLWEGLGYYSRVRNMQIAARQVMSEYGGSLPADYNKLLKLKGIGEYTAGAIASLAYNIAIPAVDGNVLRVMTRVTENHGDIMLPAVRKEIRELVQTLIPEDRPGDFNQALMELGAVVCVPNGPPHCSECPVCVFCEARQKGCQEALPVKSPKKERRIEDKTILVIQDGKYTAIRKRPKKGLLAGLYELPNVSGHIDREQALDYIRRMKLEPLQIEPLEKAKHIFSHIEWHMIAYRIRVASFEENKIPGIHFVDRKESRESYAIPSAFHAYTKYMKEE
ncbi:MAG: A/G-specific adenine glycosylase [Blautia sp.]|nr:A/G-specific adenine glycosylase [Blautia sp.]